ncbi:dubious [Schizosaccharomyces pombe]|uniref:Uncharacterized protein P27G11.11c n=1 Tax=Schizosaccharomyces pombe (strain 972 / ATCC 24843) TaxID=284812 RepID=YIOB_SCHPO|nr:uncharacterized protein SPAP27G11.11c [Schizosaccharomyces pombe]Q9P7M7.1 RecName: Full=Uncharacterized protein P27G11.11c [Schizosaccharomyces pombe 972h-]CAB76032.1 dubious [Schizosaccharomyces pombe]|eukprot:NP_593415.1 uncharacterized protein SPAP27G11.11c [Schizosaccharomyces pombe]
MTCNHENPHFLFKIDSYSKTFLLSCYCVSIYRLEECSGRFKPSSYSLHLLKSLSIIICENPSQTFNIGLNQPK